MSPLKLIHHQRASPVVEEWLLSTNRSETMMEWARMRNCDHTERTYDSMIKPRKQMEMFYMIAVLLKMVTPQQSVKSWKNNNQLHKHIREVGCTVPIVSMDREARKLRGLTCEKSVSPWIAVELLPDSIAQRCKHPLSIFSIPAVSWGCYPCPTMHIQGVTGRSLWRDWEGWWSAPCRHKVHCWPFIFLYLWE